MVEDLRFEPLAPDSFEPFGRVLETGCMEPRAINHGLTLKYADLAAPMLGGEGRAVVAIYRSQPVNLPFRIREVERHVGRSQLFMPLHHRPFPIVVGLGDDAPDSLRAFLSNGRQGVCLHPGVWHHHQISLEASCDYLVLESRDNESVTETHVLPDILMLLD